MNETEKNLAKISFETLSEVFEELLALKSTPVKFLDRHFKEMHERIVKEKTELVNTIESVYKKMIDKLKIFEYECHNMLHQRDFSFYNFDELAKSIHDLNADLEDKDKAESIRNECEALEKQIRENMEDMKESLLLYNECKFEESRVDFENLGHLKIKKKVEIHLQKFYFYVFS